ncbi:MAG: hypothetical protein HN411_01195 [Waddliaceae bacterium]|jgi:hypothetical protein|nr:hypothetical protein [Waddliaceae bacterium]MBT3579631.1 hypothetical protein [Waddliaceae bacterium]MBT4445216.1 hypothetical protein [Waddliaceae bacterium]MBT6928124.1 hypothetical protein [Waddliaceae bacterium]MBT7264685.1 hypothetical protein [Waddliaceae bacterium]
MKKKHPKTPITTLETKSSPEEKASPQEQCHDLVVKHGMTVLYTILGISLLIFVSYRFSSGRKAKATNDYYQASVLAERLQNDANDSGLLYSLQDIIAKHPELNAKYSPLITQILLGHDDIDTARDFAAETLNTTSTSSSNFYKRYTATSILIAEERFHEALTAAIDLKNDALNNEAFSPENDNFSFGDTLFAYNLLRIAILHQTLNEAENENIAWEEFKRYGDWDNDDTPNTTYQQLMNGFSEGNVSLIDYIAMRQEKLNKLL